MSAFWGMDTDLGREHADRLRAAASRAAGLRQGIDVAVASASWTGPDADAFRGDWTDLSSSRIGALVEQLQAMSGRLEGEAAQQDVVSDQTGTETGPASAPTTIPCGDASGSRHGYRNEDNPWLPDWLEDPLEGAVAGLAQVASDAIGWGFDTVMDGVEGVVGALGGRTEGISQFRRDAEHLGGILEDWATGERVPTIAELGAAAIVAGGSAGVGVYEAVTGRDAALLDDRPGGVVESVRTTTDPAASPQTLQDLILENNALRMSNPGQRPLESGQIGVQEIRSADGGEPVYIVQIPPTEGASPGSVPDAYGGQGNSRDWGSNLRLVAGQHPAAMDDVRAAMDAADVPPGANVMLVGHSQGGIVGNHLAADPSFNSSSGAPGTYNVTHSFSVGSPVQTVVPAQGTTQSVNVSHAAAISPEGVSGDGIAMLDLGGAQVGGGALAAPNRHEVVLPGYPVGSVDPITILESNHDSVGRNGDPMGGYAGSVARATGSDPTLTALQRDLTGVYIGDGTYVARSHVIEVGRGPHGG